MADVRYYTIQQGDTLWKITGGDKSKIDKIVEKNQQNGSLKNADTIFTGSILEVDVEELGDTFKKDHESELLTEKKAGSVKDNNNGNLEYAKDTDKYEYPIQQGDTLWKITGGDWNKINKILKNNPGIDPKKLQINSTLKLSDEVLAPEFKKDNAKLKKIEKTQTETTTPPVNNAAQGADFAKLAEKGVLTDKKSALKEDGKPDTSVLTSNAQPFDTTQQKQLLEKMGMTQLTENQQKKSFTIKINGIDHTIQIVKDGNDVKLVDEYTENGKAAKDVYKIDQNKLQNAQNPPQNPPANQTGRQTPPPPNQENGQRRPQRTQS